MDIYDPIHGNILIDSLAKKIIDTEEFQRLRNIKQLGCCYYVFPGASHNRFEHSLGVYHLANEYIRILNTDDQFTEQEIRCITIAALIHDLGHGPYSHLFDNLVPEEKNHEYRSSQLFKMMNDKYSLGFTADDLTFIRDIIFPEDIPQEKKYLYQIVSNPNGVDVDRFDYLMRDITMIGLNYGIEYKRIMDHSRIVNNTIVYSRKVKINIDDFFRTRFIMYKEIYNHHTVRSIEYMIQEFLRKSESIFPILEIVKNDDWDKFIMLTDGIIDIIHFIPFQDDSLLQLVRRIKQRDIYKLVGEIHSDKEILPSSNDDDIIIDVVKVSCCGYEPCHYYHEKEVLDITSDKTNNQYITSVFIKDNCNVDKGKQKIKYIHSMILDQRKNPVQYHQIQ